jgi:hypothetical protein
MKTRVVSLIYIIWQVNTNGLITFRRSGRSAPPELFPGKNPLLNNTAIVAPFWSDVNPNFKGKIYYQLRRNAYSPVTLLANRDLAAYTGDASIRMKWSIVVTWDRVQERTVIEESVS